MPHLSVFRPETREAKTPWGDLSPVVEWFLAAEPSAAPFKLKPAVTITDPARWWHDITLDIAAGSGGPRTRYGALQDDLLRLWNMFGPQVMPGGNA